MGMSASQARLLSLTARQSNLEFEGQQINQQRTSLSSQSANYYNSLLAMSVPTPPSTDDYTKVSYSFTIGGNSATIAQVLPQDGNGNYLVSYTTNLSTIGVQENSAYKITASSNNSNVKTGKTSNVTDLTVYDEDKQYYVQSFRHDSQNGTLTTLSSDNTDLSRLPKYYDSSSNPVTRSVAVDSNGTLNPGYTEAQPDVVPTYYDAKGYQVSENAALGADGSIKDGYTALVQKQSEEAGYSVVDIQLADSAAFSTARSAGESIKEFQQNTPSDNSGTDEIQTLAASNSQSFSTVGAEYSEAFLNAGLSPDDYYQYTASSGVRFAKKDDVESSANNSTLTITTYAVASLSKAEKTTMSDAQVEFDSSGRISTVTDADGNSYTMTANTATDNDAYEDAYNKYTYDQYVYDQTQNNINSHIKILQAQDKNLELRLSQLNTEHSAIQTEIDAVGKVLSKNIETSYKTFNA